MATLFKLVLITVLTIQLAEGVTQMFILKKETKKIIGQAQKLYSRSESLPDCRPFSKNCLPGNSQTAAMLRNSKPVYRTVGELGLVLVLVRVDLWVYSSPCGCCSSFPTRKARSWVRPPRPHTQRPFLTEGFPKWKAGGWLWKRWMKALGRTNWLARDSNPENIW